MNIDGSKKIVEFYIKTNKNKEKITHSIKDGRDYSKSEEVIMQCIDELLSCSNDNNKIKYLIINSVYENLDILSKGQEYKKIVDESYLMPKPFYYLEVSNGIFGMSNEREKTYNNYLKLRNRIRQGHIYWGANGNRLESILEHIYGCLIILLAIDSEYNLKIDYDKIIKMLLLHETEEIIIGDLTEWDISKEEKEVKGKKAVEKLLSNIINGKNFIEIINEFNDKKTTESKYANLIDKLEYDMQVKVYELEGRYEFSNYPKNVVTKSKSVQDIIKNGASSVFDVHYEYDKHRFDNNEEMKLILEETKKIQK